MTTLTGGSSAPKAFLSYSWDDEAHKRWVSALATQLRGDGVEAKLDQWSLVPGDRLPLFMEESIRENDFVLVICTPNYKGKSDSRKGGVGYEGDIMTAEVWAKSNHRKYIPLLRNGDWGSAAPSWLSGKYGIDLRGDPYSQEQYDDLIATLHNARGTAPPVGRPPVKIQERMAISQIPSSASLTAFEPIKITGIIADEVGQPRNDGTRGSALYSVPFKLSRRPSAEWATLFLRTWDQPPTWTSMHRPGIAEVHGDRIILTRTMLEEVREYHRDTLKGVVDAVNRQYAEFLERRLRAEQAEAAETKRRMEEVRRLADDIKFD